MATRLLAQRYELLEPLGSGAMATVWRARDQRLNREVAIKTLSEQLASDPNFRERFEREAIHVASLKHPNIVTVYDAGREGDTFYIIMELVEGMSLQSLLEAEKPYLSLEKTQDLAAQLLAGLGHAHQKGIIHRDIKPANILITGDGTAKLADFGIARAASDTRTITTIGSFLGTPAYASPEQLGAQSATAATDLYSLGCVLYECLLGHPPFEAELPVGVIAQHLQASPPALRQERPDIPPSFEAAVLKALEKESERRFSSAEEMRQAITAPLPASTASESALSTVIQPRRATGAVDQGSRTAQPAQSKDVVRVVVADDHPFFRDGVTRGLTASGQVAVVAEAENGREAVEVIRREQPAVALVDYQMPDMDGLAVVHEVVGEDLPTRVLLLSAMADSATVFKALEEGAAGYLSKDARRGEIVDAVLKAAAGDTVLPPELAGAVAGEIRSRSQPRPELSDKEQEVLRAFARGLSIPQVASELSMGASTVRTHAQRLYEKLGVSDRAAAVAEAMRQGLLE